MGSRLLIVRMRISRQVRRHSRQQHQRSRLLLQRTILLRLCLQDHRLRRLILFPTLQDPCLATPREQEWLGTLQVAMERMQAVLLRLRRLERGTE